MYLLDALLHRDRDGEPLRIATLMHHAKGFNATLVVSYLEKAGVEVHPYRAYMGEFPDPEAYDGFIGVGSSFNVRDKRGQRWLGLEKEFYREVERPTLGICFSHQVMAEAYGGMSDKAAGYELCRGAVKVHVDTSCPLYEGLDDEVFVSAVHGDEVVEVPGEFEVDAYSDICAVEGMHHREKPLYAVQFHPERASLVEQAGHSNDDGYRMLENFLGIVRENRIEREGTDPPEEEVPDQGPKGISRIGHAIGSYLKDIFGSG